MPTETSVPSFAFGSMTDKVTLKLALSTEITPLWPNKYNDHYQDKDGTGNEGNIKHNPLTLSRSNKNRQKEEPNIKKEINPDKNADDESEVQQPVNSGLQPNDVHEEGKNRIE